MIDYPSERLSYTSFLTFWFFKRGEGLTPTKIKLPFYENPKLSESQTPSYTEYSPLGRSGSLYTFTGTKSREFKLSFPLTFDHIAKFGYSIAQPTKPSDKDLFFAGTSINIENDSYSHLVNYDAKNKESDDKNTQLIMHWINLIRSSVVNNADDYSPPPLLRLNHGTMYRNVPCICTNYDISHDESAGYERTSMLPKRLVVSMTLKELRRDNLIKFSQIVGTSVGIENIELGDAVKGWEQVVDGKTMDPTLEKSESINTFIFANLLI